mgnify:FL=1
MKKVYRGTGFWMFIVLAVLIFSYFWDMGAAIKPTPYSQLVSDIESGSVSRIIVNDTKVTYYKGKDAMYSAIIPSQDTFYSDCGEQLREQMESGSLVQEAAQKKISVSAVLNILCSLLLVGLFAFMIFSKNGKAGGGFTKTSSRVDTANNLDKVTFADVAGEVEEKAELEEIVDFLKNPHKYISLGARIPKGILLVGPPGTGKTLLARAVAGEAGVPFFLMSGSDFVELYVGVGASRVRDLFEQAKRNKPCIIFIDEIDAVGRKRGAGMGGGHDEREQTLNQLLVEMDGFGKNEGVIMIAATNRPDILDPALLRPGRFDRRVVVSLPDIKGREEILKVHMRNKPIAKDIDLHEIAKKTVGYSGADLENLMNEAAIFAAKRENIEITEQDLDDANMKVMMGSAKRSKVISEKEKKLTAYHEAGHAIVTYTADSSAVVSQISIIPRGRAGGYTMSLPEDDSSCPTKGEMLSRICVLLGGRAAEELVLDDITTGASSDLKRATEIAHEMVAKYGMSEKIGPIAFANDDEVFIGRDFVHSREYSEQTAGQIDEEVKNILTSEYNAAKKILSDKSDKLDKLAKLLMEKETVSGKEFKECMEGTEE